MHLSTQRVCDLRLHVNDSHHEAVGVQDEGAPGSLEEMQMCIYSTHQSHVDCVEDLELGAF